MWLKCWLIIIELIKSNDPPLTLNWINYLKRRVTITLVNLSLHLEISSTEWRTKKPIYRPFHHFECLHGYNATYCGCPAVNESMLSLSDTLCARDSRDSFITFFPKSPKITEFSNEDKKYSKKANKKSLKTRLRR